MVKLKLHGPVGCIVFLIVAPVVMFVPALVATLGWNWLAPTFWPAAPQLGFWQVFVALLLLGIVGRALFRREGQG